MKIRESPGDGGSQEGQINAQPSGKDRRSDRSAWGPGRSWQPLMSPERPSHTGRQAHASPCPAGDRMSWWPLSSLRVWELCFDALWPRPGDGREEGDVLRLLRNSLRSESGLGVVPDRTTPASTWEAEQKDCYSFEVSLGDTVSSSPARIIE